MMSDHPHTPQSPSQIFSHSDLLVKPLSSPRASQSLPTPAHSINGSMSSLENIVAETASLTESSNKRKREPEDHGDRNQKKVHVEDSRLSIEDLHLDVGKKYLLCRTPHPNIRPHLSQDMFERYGLIDLAKSVARKLPDGTGKSLRKTYKNYIKDLKLSGNFDVDKKELDAPDTLDYMMNNLPDSEWETQMVRGNDISNGLSDAVNASMAKAFSMARGAIPKSAWKPEILGEIATPSPTPKPAVTNNAIKPPTRVGTPQGTKEVARPKRSIKKRAYGDSSYEGYGEGYVDDDGQETGYSTGDGEDRSRKRPKKSSSNHPNFQQGSMRQNSYGPGMVGA